jgi:hypothetical protein
VRERDYLSRLRATAGASLRAKEVAMLETLEAKYRRSVAFEWDIFVSQDHVRLSDRTRKSPHHAGSD